MAIVMESNVFAVIVVDSRHANYRATKITADVFDDFYRILHLAKIFPMKVTSVIMRNRL